MSPNYNPVSGLNQPIYVKSIQTITTPNIVSSPSYAAAQNGTFFAITTQSRSVAANGFLTTQLTNPANSGRTLYIQRVSGGATVNTTIDILLNATFSAAGTSITPVNSNQGSTNTSLTTSKLITQATDPTIGGIIFNSIIQTGGPVVIDFNGEIAIPPTTTNRTFYVRLVNNTNQTNLLSLNISWFELAT
ncbi:hypothetical protein YDYSG_36720 [Paenibacillus tyrfis]|uniref:hypothetical protein n=1 Tax=Paenibacillus TaxID=44249 RepID=UPI002490008A|nr:hypothetical protein [Paenibacillus tyrfis]GLI07642.1 hypothetical protein YDYSG_36720 [Paenibacillus tyrfis]GMX61700.1 hypothetical protein Elgi_15040 [Paenibacillus elgii]